MMQKVSISRFSTEKSCHLLIKILEKDYFEQFSTLTKRVSQPGRKALRLVEKCMQKTTDTKKSKPFFASLFPDKSPEVCSS